MNMLSKTTQLSPYMALAKNIPEREKQVVYGEAQGDTWSKLIVLNLLNCLD